MRSATATPTIHISTDWLQNTAKYMSSEDFHTFRRYQYCLKHNGVVYLNLDRFALSELNSHKELLTCLEEAAVMDADAADNCKQTVANDTESHDLEHEDVESDLSSDTEPKLPVVQGTLSKWTNYISGWQDRFFVLKDGTLSYFKSPEECSFGCRGAISLAKALVTPHKFDEMRFDVCVGEHLWYLRCDNADLRSTWIKALEAHRAGQDSGFGSENSLRRHNSLISVTSGSCSQSIASQGSFMRGHSIKEKLAEVETFREILSKQVDTLQSYFDVCSQLMHHPDLMRRFDDDEESEEYISEDEDGQSTGATGSGDSIVHTTTTETTTTPNSSIFSSLFSRNRNQTPSSNSANTSNVNKSIRQPVVDYEGYVNLIKQHGGHAVDFRGEAITFKATTAGIIHQMSSCVELMNQREDQWKKRLERELERRRRLEEAVRVLRQKLETANSDSGPSLQGPDFEEAHCCRLDDEEFYDAVDAQLDKLEVDAANVSLIRHCRLPNHSLSHTHPLSEEMSKICTQHWDSWGIKAGDDWELLERDADMCVYRKPQVEEGTGVIVDPILATYTVSGVSAREVTEFFWDLRYRLDWEHTLDSPPEILETPAADTVVLHQIYRRVWPTAQRDAVFWSHIRHAENRAMVVNFSTHYKEPQLPAHRCRMKLNVSMICETLGAPPARREDLRCRIQYSASIHPGGWAPASVLRQVTKREYAKFLRRFATYCRDRVRQRPIQL